MVGMEPETAVPPRVSTQGLRHAPEPEERETLKGYE